MALETAVAAVEALSELLTEHGPRNSLSGLRILHDTGRKALESQGQVTEAAIEMRRVYRNMGRGLSDIVVNADNDVDRTRLNEEFERLKSELTAAMRAASGENEAQ